MAQTKLAKLSDLIKTTEHNLERGKKRNEFYTNLKTKNEKNARKWIEEYEKKFKEAKTIEAQIKSKLGEFDSFLAKSNIFTSSNPKVAQYKRVVGLFDRLKAARELSFSLYLNVNSSGHPQSHSIKRSIDTQLRQSTYASEPSDSLVKFYRETILDLERDIREAKNDLKESRRREARNAERMRELETQNPSHAEMVDETEDRNLSHAERMRELETDFITELDEVSRTATPDYSPSTSSYSSGSDSKVTYEYTGPDLRGFLAFGAIAAAIAVTVHYSTQSDSEYEEFQKTQTESNESVEGSMATKESANQEDGFNLVEKHKQPKPEFDHIDTLVALLAEYLSTEDTRRLAINAPM